jgi:hypothetical protein
VPGVDKVDHACVPAPTGAEATKKLDSSTKVSATPSILGNFFFIDF